MSNRRRPHRVVPLVAPPAPDTRTLLERIRDDNVAALLRCTGEPNCPESIHVPGCWATR